MDAGAALPVGWINAEAASPAMYFVHADHLGTPQKLTDAAGAIAWDGVFAPFGETHAATGTLAQNLRFPGQFADSESGLSYNWHRTYDPSLGRYLQSDPIGLAGGINSYGYVGGNPLRYTDPQGLNPAVGATIGSTVAGPPGAIVGGAIGLGLSIGALAILNEILDGADDPAGKAKADAGKTGEEKCKKCDENLERDLRTCRALGKRDGKSAYKICEGQAMLRYGNCLSGRDSGINAPLPPWGTK